MDQLKEYEVFVDLGKGTVLAKPFGGDAGVTISSDVSTPVSISRCGGRLNVAPNRMQPPDSAVLSAHMSLVFKADAPVHRFETKRDEH